MADQDIRPIPDPTELTSKAVDKAVQVSRDYTEAEINHIKEWAVAENRHLRDWASIQFSLNENQRLEQKEDTKEAVKEQTAAAQLANNKSEIGFKEQLGQQDARFSTANEGINREMKVLTTRVERIESLKQGGQDVIARGLAVIFGVAALISIILYVQSIK